MNPQAQVLPIPEGSVLVLTDVRFPPEMYDAAIDAIAEAAGHNRFVVLQLDTGAGAEVWGPDDDHVAKLRALLDERDGARRAPA